jgi:hypothetical protein
MTIHTQVLEDLGVLEVIYSEGSVTDKELKEQRKVVADALEKNDMSKVLIDASALTHMPKVTTTLKHNMEVAAIETLRRTRFAILFKTMGKDEQFLEDTAVNRGIPLKAFTSREEALAWLVE